VKACAYDGGDCCPVGDRTVREEGGYILYDLPLLRDCKVDLHGKIHF
jgi:hypothetical protein